MSDIEKYFDDTTMKAAISRSMSNPAWLSKYAAETAIKADKFEKEILRLRAENEKLRAELEALKKYEREKWTGWAATLKETGDE